MPEYILDILFGLIATLAFVYFLKWLFPMEGGCGMCKILGEK